LRRKPRARKDTETKSKQTEKETNSKQKEKDEQEEKKQKSELAVAYRLITHIDWKGKILTGDALYCQRCLCFELRRAGGDYLFIVKGNQPQLFEDIRLLFAHLSPPKRAGEGILRLPEQITGPNPQQGTWACGDPKHSGLFATQRLLRLARLGTSV
jgi:hypothetical protein